ncbi:MAG: hypothetical protein IJQ90_00070, partial [Alphaproteobacteria bacterium]|nr:hypothetical protein [Alphaproteobacteria bacterium]
MKKVTLFFLLGLCYVQNGFAGCNTDHTLTFKGNQKPEHDEFLYLNKTKYDETVEGYKNTRTQNSGSGKAYECDRYHSSGCEIGDVVNMPKGHVFQGSVINKERKYQCQAGVFNDKWVAVTEDCMCCNTLQFGNIPIGGVYSKNLSKAECSGYEVSDATHGKLFQLRCLQNRNLKCYAVECDAPNMVPDSNGICVAKPNKKDTCTATIKGQRIIVDVGAEYSVELTADECIAAVKSVNVNSVYNPGLDVNGLYHFFCEPGCKRVGCKKGYIFDTKGDCMKNNPNPPKQKSCREKNKNAGAKRLACCDVEASDTGFWQANECYCKDKNAKFEIVNTDHGQCTIENNPVDPVVPPKNCSDKSNMDADCNCKALYTHVGPNGFCVCDDNNAKLVGGECVCNDSNKEIKNGKCEFSEAYLDKLRQDITDKYSKIKSLSSTFEVSKWKNEDGKFNTARLASDSIAGVVLGTVGGVVTAHVVKKN